jgi:uncharacterized protein (UPF0276 family)
MSAITSMKCRTQSVNRFLLENPSTYVAFRESTMSETDFIREIAYGMGCGLLLDVNNVFVSAANPGFSAIDYVAHFPLFRVGVSRSRVRGFGRNKACPPAMRFDAQQSGEP